MDKVIVLIIGALCGVGQFLILKRTLKPLSEGKTPQIGIMFFLQMPIPMALLLCCAFINVVLLPFAGGAFCFGLIVSAVTNHLVTQKRRDDV